MPITPEDAAFEKGSPAAANGYLNAYEAGCCMSSDGSGIRDISDDVVDTLRVLEDWVKFIGPGVNDGKIGITGLLTKGIKKKSDPFYFPVRDEILRSRRLIKNNGWEVKNGNFTYRNIDMGCPLMFRLKNSDSFVMEIAMPLMTEGGGINIYHAHVLPALIINKLLPVVSSFNKNKVSTYVLCQGNGISDTDNWWMSHVDFNSIAEKSQIVVANILQSKAFDHVFSIMSDNHFQSNKNIKRLCIWISMHAHIFTLIWEVRKNSDGSVSSSCFSVDNLVHGVFRDQIVREFVRRINVKLTNAKQTISTHSFHGLSPPGVGVALDMKCVSYMTRATLYFSMVNNSNAQYMIRMFHERVGLDIERGAFKHFTDKLLEFVKGVLESKKMVWISPINDKFVNIDDIYLMKVDPLKVGLSKGKEAFVYQGIKHGFQRFDENCVYSGCVAQSEFTFSSLDPEKEEPVSPPHPSQQMLYLTSSSLLPPPPSIDITITTIHECQSLLEKLCLKQ